MALIASRSILEIPSLEEYRTGRHRGLEHAVREDFGESGLDRLREYKVTLDLPVNTDAMLRYARIGEIVGTGFPSSIGKIYTLTGDGLCCVSAENVGVTFNRYDEHSQLRLDLDLNPDQAVRYLRLLFSIPHVDSRRR
ncbi:hypothetical protein HY495_02235 [Candidatus Woesearchaeota archaeon]|nr:hypothetical protein [Candidatus Woesearchaeota archaeon]